MNKEVNPQLLEDVKNTLMNGGAVEKTALAILYKHAFGLELNIKCHDCIEQGIKALKHKFGIVKTKTKSNQMKNFKWTSNKQYEKASVTFRVGGKLTTVTKDNVTDATAEMIYGNKKYAHLIEPVGVVSENEADPNEHPQVLTVNEPTVSDTAPATSVDITLTSGEPKKEKKKPGPKPKNQQ